MTITGLENNYYLSGNDIWIQVDTPDNIPLKLELECSNASTGQSLGLLKLYPSPGKVFRFNVSLPIRALQPEPDHITLNTMQLYSLKFTLSFAADPITAITPESQIITLDKYFIRGGRDKRATNEWFLTSTSTLIVGDWIKWAGITLPGFAKRIQGSEIVDFVPSDAYEMLVPGLCDYRIIKFLNSLGAYQFYIFEGSEIQTDSKPKKNIYRPTYRLRESGVRSLGTDTEEILVLKTKTPGAIQAVIQDLIKSQDVLLYEPDNLGADWEPFDPETPTLPAYPPDNDSRWHRLELMSNDAFKSTKDGSYQNELKFRFPNYINRDL